MSTAITPAHGDLLEPFRNLALHVNELSTTNNSNNKHVAGSGLPVVQSPSGPDAVDFWNLTVEQYRRYTPAITHISNILNVLRAF